MSKQYTLPEDDAPKMAGEAMAAYAIPQTSELARLSTHGAQEHTSMYYQVSKVHDAKDVEAFAKKVCFTDKAYEYHKQHGFYNAMMPEQKTFESEEQLVASLDAADAEGYITDDETNHLMNLWKVVD